MNLIVVLLLFFSRHLSSETVPKDTVQLILNEVINCRELAVFTAHYTKREDLMYFHFVPSAQYPRQTLQELRAVELTLSNSARLVYDEQQDEKRKPVVTIQLVQMAQDRAEVRIGFPIEGVVGRFTLMKEGTWHILERDVYEI